MSKSSLKKLEYEKNYRKKNRDRLNKWHIDHIRPLASFDLDDEVRFKKACHYSNLQPLWGQENIKKGSKYE